MKARILLPFLLPLAACASGGDTSEGPAETFDGIAEGETVNLVGTEPFWSAEIAHGEARYSTPEDIDGVRFAVERFAGLNGVGFSGVMGGQRFDATVTPGECSDGMSDRTYPFTATVIMGETQLMGCAWSERQPFDGPEMP